MVGDPRVMTFVPGEEPGDYALGPPYGPGELSDAAAYKLRMRRMPVGYQVAERFPWLRKVHETLEPGDKLALLRPGWPATFINNSDHDVQVEEIRFYTPWSAIETLPTAYQTDLWCKINIPPRREIVADWLPLYTVHTEIDRIVPANMDSFSYELPAPYVLQRGNQFVLDMRYNAAYSTTGQVPNDIDPQDWVIMVGLHGYGLQDGEPISLMKAVKGWPFVVGATDQWQVVAFDEEQGRPMRDAVITHISFGSAITTNELGVLEGLEFRTHAPEGPEWHQNEFFAIRDVAEQVGRAMDIDEFIIHRPIVPYTLLKGEGMMIELWNRSQINTLSVDVILRGHYYGQGR